MIQTLTVWHSTLGMADSHDFATRGYLKALMSAKHQGLRIPPSISTSLLRFDKKSDSEIVGFAELVKPTGQHQMAPLKRIKAGDPRIGTIKVIDGFDKLGNSSKEKILITEGSVDLDIKQEFSSNVISKVQCVVIHHDPASICRHYTNLVKMGRPSGVAYVGVTVWEPSSIPEAVAKMLSELDLIIVPSKHTKKAFLDSGVSTVVEVVPHTFDVEKWPKPTSEELENNNKDKYVLYSIANPIERKNLKGLIRAYFKAFSGRKDVILKIKSGEKPKLREIAQDAFSESGISAAERPPLRFFVESWSIDKMRAFHLDGDCYVSATRGEGFGLCELEAKLCGNRVITTDWGACKEFLTNDILVPYKLVNVFGMYGIGCYEVDQQWAEPDEDHLIDAMKYVKEKSSYVDYTAWNVLERKLRLKKIGGRLSILLREAEIRAIAEAEEDRADEV
jgi:glycosyltransferase involved in cell wall biosynthesis